MGKRAYWEIYFGDCVLAWARKCTVNRTPWFPISKEENSAPRWWDWSEQETSGKGKGRRRSADVAKAQRRFSRGTNELRITKTRIRIIHKVSLRITSIWAAQEFRHGCHESLIHGERARETPQLKAVITGDGAWPAGTQAAGKGQTHAAVVWWVRSVHYWDYLVAAYRARSNYKGEGGMGGRNFKPQILGPANSPWFYFACLHLSLLFTPSSFTWHY